MGDENDRAIQAISRLKTERDELRRKEQVNKDEKEKAIEYVKKLVEKHQEEKTGYMSRITMLEDALERDKENRADYMKIQIKRKIKAKDDELDEMKRQQVRIQGETETAKRQLSDIRTKLAQADAERLQLMRQNKGLESELSTARKDVAEATSTQSEKISDYRRQISNLETLSNQSQGKVEALTKDNRRLKEHVESLRGELADQNAKLASRREAESKRLTEMEGDFARLESEKEELTAQVDALQKAIQDVEAELESANLENSSLMRQMDATKSTDRKLAESLKKAETESARMVSALTLEKEELVEAVELVNINLTQKEKELDQAYVELESLREKLEDSETRTLEAQRQAEDTGKRLDALIKEHAALEQRLRLISEENSVKQATAVKSNTHLQRALETAEEEKLEVQAELNQAIEQQETTQRELRKCQKELETLKSRHEKVKDQLATDTEKLQGRIEEKEALDRERQSEHDQLSEENERFRGELEVARLNYNELRLESDRLEDLVATKASEVDNLYGEIQRLQENERNAQNAVAESKVRSEAENRQNEQKFEEIVEEKETLISNIATLSAEKDQLEEECNQLQRELAIKDEQLGKQSRDLAEIADENDQNLEELNQNMAELKSEKTQLITVVRELEDQLEEADGNINKLYEQLEAKEAEALELSENLVNERAARTELEAKHNLFQRNQLKVEEKRNQRERDEVNEKEAENEHLKGQLRQYKLALESAQQDMREVEHEKEELFRRLDLADKKTGSNKKTQRALELENAELEEKLTEITRTLRKNQELKLASHEESEKWRIGYEKTAGLIEAEREKNNQLKHENKELSLSETRLRTQMFQLQKMNEMLQRQTEGTKKRKSQSKKNEPKLFVPPPMYAELEKQVETLRKENAKMKAKLFGSNTDLTDLGGELPVKPKRNVRAVPIEVKEATSETAAQPGLCYASSLPIYVGDQIVSSDGAKCHERFVEDFNRIKHRNAAGKKTVMTGGALKRLVDGKWIKVEVIIRDKALVMKGENGFSDTVTLAANWAIHGAVHFEQVAYMAEVDHEMCFALEEMDMKEFVYFCANDLIDKQSWYYNIDKQLNLPVLPMNDRSKVRVKKIKEFSISSSGTYPSITSAVYVEQNCLLGSQNQGLLAMLPSGEIQTLSSIPTSCLAVTDRFVFLIRHGHREFGYFLLSDVAGAIHTGKERSSN